ncbi:MAG: glycogen/starch synthase [Thermodesulfobacteriota bacterium]
MSVKLAFVTYETPFAPCGGIAAVMGRLPGYVQKASGLDTIVITPFHYKIEKTSFLDDKIKLMTNINVPFDNKNVRVELYQYNDNRYEWTWYFLKPKDSRFFAGRRHPYDVGETQGEVSGNLLRDSLFFGTATACVLNLIDRTCHWKVMIQDWEAATTVLAMTGRGKNQHLYITLHNSYDSGVTDADLSRVGIDSVSCPGETILQRALPLAERPVFTVSSQFAMDLTEDPLHAEVMAAHLKDILKPRLFGVDNGLFASLAISENILAEIMRGNFTPVRKWKNTRRKEALKSLDEFSPSKEKPIWGDLKRLRRDDSPWFIMAGRDDPRQKGYDVAVLAISEFLEKGGEARFFLFPIPGDEGLEGLHFLQKMSERFSESVLVLPFLFQEGFFAVLQGATYGIMPSLYEPFGMANEFYLNGTVGIGRATGGVVQQIVPLRSVPSFTRAVQVRSEHWHTASATPTGILFRERDNIESAVDDWRGINFAGYDIKDKGLDRVEQRKRYPLFRSIAHELMLSIIDAVRVYRDTPELYYRMLAEGINHIRRSFSWERAAREYIRHIII